MRGIMNRSIPVQGTNELKRPNAKTTTLAKHRPNGSFTLPYVPNSARSACVSNEAILKVRDFGPFIPHNNHQRPPKGPERIARQ